MNRTKKEKLEEWVAIHLVPGIGNITFKKLIERFKSPDNILNASLSELMEVEGVGKELALRISKGMWSEDPVKFIDKVKSIGARLITYSDNDYPAILKQIYDPPMLLYIKGNGIPSDMENIAIVGSRRPTPYGIKVARELAGELSEYGFGIVSGMAYGIDTSAHWGTISKNGFTIAVLGTGINIIYPPSNKKLYNEILKKGALITEFPPDTLPEGKNFPVRNRIISGLSRGVIVIEAATKSGSLITANIALEQGREVFAVPGSINSSKSRGTHHLIKQGARLVENAEDVLEELGYENRSSDNANEKEEISPIPKMEDIERQIYIIVGDYPIHIDEIVNRCKLRPSEASSILMKMEIKGLVRQLPGKLFVREAHGKEPVNS